VLCCGLVQTGYKYRLELVHLFEDGPPRPEYMRIWSACRRAMLQSGQEVI
jgi:hypothetical protein